MLNANINIIFYFLSALMAFYSRKIFLDKLGNDFIGLFGTLGNMLGLLNLAELGIGTAVGVHLYKPIFNEDKKNINEIISVFGFLWRRVGLVILSIGIMLSLFLTIFFAHAGISFRVIYFLFYSLLSSTLIGYFINYKQIMISSIQKNYIISMYFNIAMLAKTLVQIFYILYYHDFYGWIIIGLVFNIGYSLVLNLKIKSEFPWLNTSVKQGKDLFKEYKTLWTKTKQVFAHKVSYLVLNQTDQILIFSFTSLATVAYYGNYTLVINKLGSMFDVLFTGLNAGIGNLIEEKNTNKLKQVFWELNSFRYWMAGCLVILLYFTIEPFIRLWVGPEYIMNRNVLFLALLNLYLYQIVSTVELFKSSFGLFQDIWAPFAEVLINLSLALILGHFWGLTGVLAGTAFSAFFIRTLWKPYFLYKRGFMEPLINYWKIIFKYLGGFMLTIILVTLANAWLLPINTKVIGGFLLYCIIIALLCFIVYGLFLALTDKGFRGFMIRMYSIIKNNITGFKSKPTTGTSLRA